MTWLAVEILVINLVVIVTGLVAGRVGIRYVDRRIRAVASVKGDTT